MTSFHNAILHARVVTVSKQTNQTMNRMFEHYFSVCYRWQRYVISEAKFDQHLPLYCGSVKPKWPRRPAYWFLWESFEMWFLKFTDSLGIVLQKYTWEQLQLLSHWNNMERKWNVQFDWQKCRWHRDVYIPYDVSLYQRIEIHVPVVSHKQSMRAVKFIVKMWTERAPFFCKSSLLFTRGRYLNTASLRQTNKQTKWKCKEIW